MVNGGSLVHFSSNLYVLGNLQGSKQTTWGTLQELWHSTYLRSLGGEAVGRYDDGCRQWLRLLLSQHWWWCDVGYYTSDRRHWARDEGRHWRHVGQLSQEGHTTFTTSLSSLSTLCQHNTYKKSFITTELLYATCALIRNYISQGNYYYYVQLLQLASRAFLEELKLNNLQPRGKCLDLNI